MGDADARAVDFVIRLRDQASAALAAFQQKLAAMTGQAANAAAAPAIDKAADSAGTLTENMTAATKATTETSKAVAKVDTNVKSSTTSLRGFLLTLHAVIAGVEIVKALWETTRAVIAQSQGDEKTQLEAAAAAQQAIKAVPIVGSSVLEIGELLNRFISATDHFVRGYGFISDLGLADQAKEETAELDKQTAKLAQRLELQRKALTDQKSLTDQLTKDFDSIFLSDDDRQAKRFDDLKKRRDEIVQEMQNTNFGGNLDPQIAAFTQDFDTKLAILKQHYKDVYVSFQRQAQSELEELQLKGVDRVSDAERLAIVEQMTQRLQAIRTQGPEVAALSEKIFTTTLANFDRELAEKRRQFLTDLNADLQSRALNATGNPEDARRAQTIELLAKQQQEALQLQKELRDSGLGADDQAGKLNALDSVQAAERAALARDQLNQRGSESLTKLSNEQGDLTREIERTKQAYADGAITAEQAEADTSAAVKQLQDDTERTAHDIDGLLASGILSPEQADALKRRLTDVKNAAKDATDVARDAAIQLQRDTGSAISDFAVSTVKNFNSIGSAAASMLQTISDGLLKLASQNIANQITSKLSGGESGGGIFGLLGKLFTLGLGGGGGGTDFVAGDLAGSSGGADFGFSRGGIVPGSGTGDTVRAMLTPREVITPVPVVDAFGGPEAFQDFIAMALGFRSRRPVSPSFAGGVQYLASGGTVSRGPRGQQTPVHVLPVLATNEQLADSIFKGGGNALVRAVANKRAQILAVLHS